MREMTIVDPEDAIPYKNVSDAQEIARYFSHPKWKRLLQDSSLWFSNTNEFFDKREREIPESFYTNNYGIPADKREKVKHINDAFKDATQAYVSCWTKFETENYALWKIYDNVEEKSEQNQGICLVTTVGELKGQLKAHNVIYGDVKYINPDVKQYIDLRSVLYDTGSKIFSIYVRELFKIYPYKYENEFRGIIHDSGKSEKGIAIPIDMKALAHRIYLNPFADSAQKEQIRNELEKYFSRSIIKDSIIDEKN